jgi:hypothetical protein
MNWCNGAKRGSRLVFLKGWVKPLKQDVFLDLRSLKLCKLSIRYGVRKSGGELVAFSAEAKAKLKPSIGI